MTELTIQFVPHSEIVDMSSEERVKKLLKIVKEEKIVLLEGRLTKSEEAALIAKTMESIDKRFKGIELATIAPPKTEMQWHKKLKTQIANLLLGEREGVTIIGPATVVSEIKQDPNKIQLFTVDKR